MNTENTVSIILQTLKDKDSKILMSNKQSFKSLKSSEVKQKQTSSKKPIVSDFTTSTSYRNKKSFTASNQQNLRKFI